jgi:uncharacterized protein
MGCKRLLRVSFALSLGAVSLGALSLGALGCHASNPTSPQPPQAGVPAIEVEILGRMKGEVTCRETAEEVVDMQRRCDKSHWAECVYAATMYANGCGVAEAPAVAAGLYHRACSFGSMVGCTMDAYHTKDLERRLALLETPCARGYAFACGNLAGALLTRGREVDVPREAALLKTACDQDNVFCPVLGRLVMEQKLAARYQEAQADLERTCQGKEQESCELLAYAYHEGALGVTDPERALAIYKASCGERHFPSCDALGHLYVLGRDHDKDVSDGVEIFYGLCAEGYGPGCSSMGQAVEKGWEPAASAAEAVPFYERACELGGEADCQRARELGGKK